MGDSAIDKQDAHEPREIGDAVVYPPGSPEYEACTEYERDLIDTILMLLPAIDAWQRRAERAQDEVLTLRMALCRLEEWEAVSWHEYRARHPDAAEFVDMEFRRIVRAALKRHDRPDDGEGF